MKTVKIGTSNLNVPAIALGCMRMADMDLNHAVKIIESAIERGINFFDHADIYGAGDCEIIFGEVCRRAKIRREDIFIQTKCGVITGGMYDLSKNHIVRSVDESLSRLGVSYLDSMLLHRPDALMRPEEIAEAFDILEKAGKVRSFGVSNFTPMQIELLKKCVKQHINVNQLQFNVAHAGMISSGLEMNMTTDKAVDRDGGVLDYCRLNDITIQTWSPLHYGFMNGIYIGNNKKYKKLNEKLEEIAKKRRVTSTTIAIAWILHHPAGMQAIVGTMNESRLDEICQAHYVELSRKEWYEIYQAAGNLVP